MHTLIAARTTVTLMVLVVLAACNAQTPSASPTSVSPTATPGSTSTIAASPTPTQSPAADCVNPPVDITSLINVADPVACYGSAPLTFDAYLVGGVADCPVTVEPDWLACPQWSLLLVGETRKVGAPELSVALDPAVSSGGNANVHVTGHFDDPAAQTCHETQRPPSVGGTPEPMADTIARCRRTFVVTQLVPIQP